MLSLAGDMNRCAEIKAQFNKENQRGKRLANRRINGGPLVFEKVYTLATSGRRTQLIIDDNHIAIEASDVEKLIDYVE